MPSQTDLDQGGTARRWAKQYLGPTLGWVWVPTQNGLADPGGINPAAIITPGTYNINLSTNFVQVSVAGAVTLTLPSALTRLGIRGNAQPGLAVGASITIVDIGGFAAANPITIQPVSVAETIMGLAQIQITSNYGGFILQPSSTLLGWVNAQ